MSYNARVFRILIASPSDVEEEREIAVKTIQEWNDLNSAERQIVLLPLRWETHSAPEYGKRPQEVINRQVVDHCDLLVGIFWSRIGTSTGKAESGTLEEIERVAGKGKMVMLYFSKAKQDPDTLDLEQLAKLRDFKKKTFPKALIETYGSQVEFKDKLAKQLEIQLRAILADQTAEDMKVGSDLPVTDIKFEFADPASGEEIGAEYSAEVTNWMIKNFESLPDYGPADEEASDQEDDDPSAASAARLFGASSPNKDYYRQVVTYAVQRKMLIPIRFWLQNVGSVGARDVYIDISIETPAPGIIVASKDSVPVEPPPKDRQMMYLGRFAGTFANSPNELYSKSSESWGTKLELRALQPQRIIAPEVDFLVGAIASTQAKITARIYADTLSQPIEHTITLRLNVETTEVDANELLKELDRRPRRRRRGETKEREG